MSTMVHHSRHSIMPFGRLCHIFNEVAARNAARMGGEP